MATNLVYDSLRGLSVTASDPTTPASGGPVRVGRLVGVAIIDETSDGKTSVDLGPAVYSLSVKGVDDTGNVAVAVGDRIFYVDADTPKLSRKSSGEFFGVALEAVTSGSTTTIQVALVGVGGGTGGQIDAGSIDPTKLGLLVTGDTGDLAALDLVYLKSYDATDGRFVAGKADANVADADAQYIAPTAITAGDVERVYKAFLSGATLNTAGATVGDAVFLSETAGGWTLTAPTASGSRVQIVGRVVVVSATVGQIMFDLEFPRRRIGGGELMAAINIATTGTIVVTNATANALTAGRQGTTNPAFNVDASAATSVTGVEIVAAAAGSRAVLRGISSGASEGLDVEAKGTGTIRVASVSTGAVSFGNSTNPALNVVLATAGTGISVTSAAAGSRAALAAISSGADEGLDLDAKGTGTIRLGNTSTGNIVVSRALAASLGITSSSPTAGIGYAAGAGGTVTQLTSKATTVILNTICGTIVLHNASLAADTTVAFTLTDSAIAAGDVVIVVHDLTGTIGAYSFGVTPAAGSALISVHNNTPGALGEAIQLRFAVIKAVVA